MGGVSGYGGGPTKQGVFLKSEKTNGGAAEGQPSAHRVRLPGFIVDEDVGLGDIIKRATYRMGIAPCGGCEKRAVALNRWVRFTHAKH